MAGEDTAGAAAAEPFDAFGTAPEPAEPGQGTTEPEGVFAPYLQEVPEEHRDVVGGYLKDAEKNVNAKLREAADLQSQFGPYREVDLSSVTPEQLQNVLAFVREVGSSPEAYQEWLRQEATEAGLLQAEDVTQEADQDLEAYIQSRIEAALNPVTQKLSQFEQQTEQEAVQQAEQQIETHINSTFDKLEQEHSIKLSDEQKEAILALSEQIEDDDFVEQGFAKLRQLEGGAQAGLIKDKTGQPKAPVRAGGQPAPAQAKTFGDVREAALEMLNQAL